MENRTSERDELLEKLGRMLLLETQSVSLNCLIALYGEFIKITDDNYLPETNAEKEDDGINARLRAAKQYRGVIEAEFDKTSEELQKVTSELNKMYEVIDLKPEYCNPDNLADLVINITNGTAKTLEEAIVRLRIPN